MRNDVFISYKSECIETVKALVHTLESNGIRCWYAPRDLDRSGAGRDYDDEIIDAIKSSSALVCVLTDDALMSTWVKREVTQAEKYDKFIIPYAISNLNVDNGLRMRLENKHWINAFPNPEEKFAYLIRNIKVVLSRTDSDGNLPMLEEISSIPASRTDTDYEEAMAFLEMNEVPMAAASLLKSMENGNQKAACELCALFEENEFLSDDEQMGERIEALSDAGSAEADLLLYYKYDRVVRRNDLAIKYLRRSIGRSPSGLGYMRLAVSYGWGLGVEQNYVLEMHYCNKAIELGCAKAYSYLGQIYEFGTDKLSKDLGKAEEFYRKGAERKDPRSCKRLFNLYWDKDLDKAEEIGKSMVEQGISGMLSQMGQLYTYRSCFVEYGSEEYNSLIRKAVKYYEKAIEKNDPGAYSAYAFFCYYSEDNADKALELADMAISNYDTTAYQIRGTIMMDRGDYPQAWEAYKNWYETKGSGAAELASLVLDKSYQVSAQDLDYLQEALQVSARNNLNDPLTMLLRLFCYRSTGELCAEPDMNVLMSLPQSYPYIAMGEKSDNGSLKYLCAQLMLEKGSRYYNPLKAEKLLAEASGMDCYDAFERYMKLNHQKDSISALKSILLSLDRTADGFEARFTSLLSNCINRMFLSENFLTEAARDYSETFLNMCRFKNPSDGVEESIIIKAFSEGRSRLKSYSFYKLLLDEYKKGNVSLSEQDLQIIREAETKALGYYSEADGRSYFSPGLSGFLSDHYDILFPEIMLDEVMSGKKEFDYENDMRLLYSKCVHLNQNYKRYPLSEQDFVADDVVLRRLYARFLEDGSCARVQRTEAVFDISARDLKDTIQAMGELCSLYRRLMPSGGYGPYEDIAKGLEPFDGASLYPFVSLSAIVRYSQSIFAALLSLRTGLPDKIWSLILAVLAADYSSEQVDELCDAIDAQSDLGIFIIDCISVICDLRDHYVVAQNLTLMALSAQEEDRENICGLLNGVLENLESRGFTHNIKRFTPEDFLPEAGLVTDCLSHSYECASPVW